jgi:hypothetical protein
MAGNPQYLAIPEIRNGFPWPDITTAASRGARDIRFLTALPAAPIMGGLLPE